MNIYLIRVSTYGDNGGIDSIIGAKTSLECARQHVKELVEKRKANFNVIDEVEVEEGWEWKLVCVPADEKLHEKISEYEVVYRISEIDLCEDSNVPDAARPVLEQRCNALTEENDQLRKEISKCKSAISASQCYLTFYDGGKYEDRDNILKNVHAARQILEMGKPGNELILELFEQWKKNEDEKNRRQ